MNREDPFGHRKISWQDLLMEEMQDHGESLDDIESSTLTDKSMLRQFDDGFGEAKGEPFTVWTKKRVYFPATYDGSEWVSSVSRHPDGIPTSHVGI